MGIVAIERDMLGAERKQIVDRRIDGKAGQWARRARELKPGLLDVVHIKVGVPQGVNELARIEPHRARQHDDGRVRLARHVERHA